MTPRNNAANAAELKAVEQRLERKRAELSQTEAEVADHLRRRQALEQEAAALREQRERLLANSEAPVVSEHAMLRYLERVKGIDLEAVRAEILGDGRAELIHKLQTCNLPLGGGLRLLVRNRQVVSVVPHGSRKKRR